MTACTGETDVPPAPLTEHANPVDGNGGAQRPDHESEAQTPEPRRQIDNYELSTHCGIFEIADGDRFYVREGGRLDDGTGNPPEGWDNPFQVGTLTFTFEQEAVFTDDNDHREIFVYDPSKTDFEFYCD